MIFSAFWTCFLRFPFKSLDKCFISFTVLQYMKIIKKEIIIYRHNKKETQQSNSKDITGGENK